jgi:histidinol-phosphate aminotransferase
VNRVWQSEANFFLVEFADSSTVLQQVYADKVLLRSFGGLLKHCVRITVGTREENERLLQSLSKVTGS